MDNKFFLSIVIPVYNVESYVEKCIRTCMNQDISPSEYEVICVNDGSKDNSLDVVNRVANDYTNIQVISQPNGGLSSARNTGVKHSCGQYIMFVDSDDWIADNCLGKLIKKLKEEKPDALVISVANVFPDGIKVKQKFTSGLQISGKELLKMKVSPCAQYAIWSSDFLKQHNLSFFEGIFHEDSEFTPRAYYLAEKISLSTDVTYFVRQNPNSIMRSVNPKKSFDLVEFVCEHLSDFCNQVDKDFKYVYHNMISMYLNNALANILKSDKQAQDKLNECIYKHRSLFYHLNNSTEKKYIIEGFFFNLFPKHCLEVYKIMKHL